MVQRRVAKMTRPVQHLVAQMASAVGQVTGAVQHLVAQMASAVQGLSAEVHHAFVDGLVEVQDSLASADHTASEIAARGDETGAEGHVGADVATAESAEQSSTERLLRRVV